MPDQLPGFSRRERSTHIRIFTLSTLSDAIDAIKEVIKLTDDVKRTGETLKELSKELREHDRRITRLEAQWETAMRLSTPRGFNQLEGQQES